MSGSVRAGQSGVSAPHSSCPPIPTWETLRPWSVTSVSAPQSSPAWPPRLSAGMLLALTGRVGPVSSFSASELPSYPVPWVDGMEPRGEMLRATGTRGPLASLPACGAGRGERGNYSSQLSRLHREGDLTPLSTNRFQAFSSGLYDVTKR